VGALARLAAVPQPRAFFAERREDGAALFFEEALGEDPHILLGEGGEEQGGVARGGDDLGAAHESDGWVGRWGPWVMAGHDET
jgi:hypothetical protein